MSREELTREERLAEMLASHEALAEEWKAQAEAYRVELEVTRDKLAAAERKAEQHTKVAFSYEESLQRAEARVRELEAETVALDAAHRRMLDERNEWQDTAVAYLDEGRARWEAAEARVRELEDRIEDAAPADHDRAVLEKAVIEAAKRAFLGNLRGPAYTLAEGEFMDALAELARREAKRVNVRRVGDDTEEHW